MTYLTVQAQLLKAPPLSSDTEQTFLQSGLYGESSYYELHSYYNAFFLTLKHVKSGPVHPTWHVNVIHEALYVQRQVGGVGAHQFLQFLTLLVQP